MTYNIFLLQGKMLYKPGKEEMMLEAACMMCYRSAIGYWKHLSARCCSGFQPMTYNIFLLQGGGLVELVTDALTLMELSKQSKNAVPSDSTHDHRAIAFL